MSVGAVLEQLPEQHSRFAAQAPPLGKQLTQVMVMGSQILEQHWESLLQAPALATQQAPLLHVWPVEQPGAQLPPQRSSPHVLPAQLGVQHVALTHTWPEEHVKTQAPMPSHARHWPASQGAFRQTEPHA